MLLVLAVAANTRASIPITGLGSNSFEIDAGTAAGPYSQTASSLLFSNNFALGNTVSGAFGSLANPIIMDLSSFPAFGLNMALTGGEAYNASFSVEFFGYDGLAMSFYTLGLVLQGSTTGLGTENATFWLEVPNTDIDGNPAIPTPLFSSLTNVAGLTFTWISDPAPVNTNNPVLLSTAIGSLVGAKSEGYFVARSPGGFRFITSAATNALTPNLDFNGSTNGTILPAGASAWQALSDSNAKTDITAIDHREILNKLRALPVTAWNYKHNPTLGHLGPMAQDFRAAFGLGFDDKHISTLDADGVALSAIKGLVEELRERMDRSEAQQRRLCDLEAELRALEELVEGLPPVAPNAP